MMSDEKHIFHKQRKYSFFLRLGLYLLLFGFSQVSYSKVSNSKVFHSSKTRSILMELYSSEGCSSCPPAEKQMGRLLKDSKLWRKIIPVNFHVDYWNRLGWVDPYSNAQFTKRQRLYSLFWGSETMYTPAFVNNGASIGASINLTKTGGQTKLSKVPKLTLSIDEKNTLSLDTSELPKGQYEAHLVMLGNGLTSKIPAGENKGRTLVQNFVVLDYKKVPLKKGKAHEAITKGTKTAKAKSYSVAAWITRKGHPVPLQAVGGNL